MHLHDKSSEVCIKTRSTLASLPYKGQFTEQTTVKWSIGATLPMKHALRESWELYSSKQISSANPDEYNYHDSLQAHLTEKIGH